MTVIIITAPLIELLVTTPPKISSCHAYIHTLNLFKVA